MQTSLGAWVKFAVVFCACLLIRFVPFRPPNIEPILALQMPFAKAYGAWFGFIFGFSSIIVFDLITGSVGVWTIAAASMYGLLGIWSSSYLQNRANTQTTYIRFAIISTIVYDIATGCTLGPIFFNQPFMAAVVGQIPFTALHLLGNIGFAFLFSPALYRVLTTSKQYKAVAVSFLNSKHI